MPVNLTQQWLKERPESVYQAFLPQLGQRERQYYGQRFPQVYGQYQGQQAQQAMGGQMPYLDFSEYLKNFQWLRDYQINRPAPYNSVTPRSTRFLYNY